MMQLLIKLLADSNKKNQVFHNIWSMVSSKQLIDK